MNCKEKKGLICFAPIRGKLYQSLFLFTWLREVIALESETPEVEPTAPVETTEPTTQEGSTTETPTTNEPGTDSTQSEAIISNDSSDPQTVIPVEIREYTPFVTDSGNINVIHEITLGDLLVSTLIMALLVFTVISRLVRR